MIHVMAPWSVLSILRPGPLWREGRAYKAPRDAAHELSTYLLLLLPFPLVVDEKALLVLGHRTSPHPTFTGRSIDVGPGFLCLRLLPCACFVQQEAVSCRGCIGATSVRLSVSWGGGLCDDQREGGEMDEKALLVLSCPPPPDPTCQGMGRCSWTQPCKRLTTLSASRSRRQSPAGTAPALFLPIGLGNWVGGGTRRDGQSPNQPTHPPTHPPHPDPQEEPRLGQDQGD